jgi:hypothetical protein
MNYMDSWVGGFLEKNSNVTNKDDVASGYCKFKWLLDYYGGNRYDDDLIGVPYIRLAEMYFNYAEAMNELYGPDNGNGGMSAIEAINTVRARLICPPNNQIQNNQSDPYYYVLVERTENPDFPVLPQGLPGLPTGMSKEQARDKIQNERIIEFAFEDQYFYDILRWKRGPELIGGAIYGVDIVKSGDTYSYNRIKVEDRIFDAGRMYLYPIPQDEVYNLGIEQNPGW